MPPAKKTQQDEFSTSKSLATTTTQARKGKNGNGGGPSTAQQSGGNNALKDLVLVTSEGNAAIAANQQAPSTGMAWQTAPIALLNMYRVTHGLSSPAAFTSPRNQALLTNPGIGRKSPTMARKKDKRRTSKETLALAVRKNFNGAAVNEIDVVVDLMYRVRNKDKAFRIRASPGVSKKAAS